jgi:hypothetical protein
VVRAAACDLCAGGGFALARLRPGVCRT